MKTLITAKMLEFLKNAMESVKKKLEKSKNVEHLKNDDYLFRFLVTLVLGKAYQSILFFKGGVLRQLSQ